MYILQNKINDQYLESISGNGIPSFTDIKTRSLIFFDFDEDLYALSYSNQFSEDEIDIKNNGSPNTDRVGDFYE